LFTALLQTRADARETRDSVSLMKILIPEKIYSLNVRRMLAAWKLEKFTKTAFDFKSFKVIDVGTPRKVVSGACYDKQQVCVYLQPFSC